MDDSKERTVTSKQQVQRRSTGNIPENDDGVPRNEAIFDRTRTGEVLDSLCGRRDGISRDKPPNYTEYRRFGPGVHRRRY